MVATATSCGDVVDSSVDSQIWTWRQEASNETKELDTSLSHRIILEQESFKSTELPLIAFPNNLSGRLFANHLGLVRELTGDRSETPTCQRAN
jgi:hypothetical protein